MMMKMEEKAEILIGHLPTACACGGEQPVVADAVEPFGQDMEHKRLMNSSGPSVTVRYRAPLRR